MVSSVAFMGAVWVRRRMRQFMEERRKVKVLEEAEALKRITETKSRFTRALQLDRLHRIRPEAALGKEVVEFLISQSCVFLKVT